VAMSTGSARHSSTPGPSTQPTPTSSYKQELATLFGVSAVMMDQADMSLHRCYERFLAAQDVIKKAQDMWEAQTWPYPKRGLEKDLVEIFVSKSVWFASYKKTFPFLSKYPEMKLWLEKSPDAEVDVDVWGFKKESYSFSDLIGYIERGGPWEESEEEVIVAKKRKGKQKEEDIRDKRRKVGSPRKNV